MSRITYVRFWLLLRLLLLLLLWNVLRAFVSSDASTIRCCGGSDTHTHSDSRTPVSCIIKWQGIRPEAASATTTTKATMGDEKRRKSHRRIESGWCWFLFVWLWLFFSFFGLVYTRYCTCQWWGFNGCNGSNAIWYFASAVKLKNFTFVSGLNANNFDNMN